MSDEYIHTVALMLIVLNAIGFLTAPFVFGESRGTYNPKDWLIKLLIFLVMDLPVLLYVINHLN